MENNVLSVTGDLIDDCSSLESAVNGMGFTIFDWECVLADDPFGTPSVDVYPLGVFRIEDSCASFLSVWNSSVTFPYNEVCGNDSTSVGTSSTSTVEILVPTATSTMSSPDVSIGLGFIAFAILLVGLIAAFKK